MKITRKDVEYVARLARLKLTEEEKEKFSSQLESIISYIDQLNELDTREIEPTSHILDLENAFREDEVKKSSAELIKQILNNAPDREGNFFKVKKVIE
ncbi:MAG: Asp-tRNA(Asn)/Glu-tRNA(Gln) amidotransferase subunit GatC [Elusimicrobia bacterium]|nr:Asp-tRNA(Asn)/Glu-tRNA(Gln) amidotransferase subunit GatC [Elusimicrobiota bacterium]